jgi:hypothetical protein
MVGMRTVRTTGPHGPLPGILAAGFVCGTLDGLSAIAVSAYYGFGPLRVFQGIAKGLLGPSALQGGIGTALAGVGLHFVVATGAATVYYLASRWRPILLYHAVMFGVAFGALVDLFMTFVVVPLSAIGRRPFVLQPFVILLLVSMFVVGPSISLTLRHWEMRRPTR